jgi:hypothetical protein
MKVIDPLGRGELDGVLQRHFASVAGATADISHEPLVCKSQDFECHGVVSLENGDYPFCPNRTSKLAIAALIMIFSSDGRIMEEQTGFANGADKLRSSNISSCTAILPKRAAKTNRRCRISLNFDPIAGRTFPRPRHRTTSIRAPVVATRKAGQGA